LIIFGLILIEKNMFSSNALLVHLWCDIWLARR